MLALIELDLIILGTIHSTMNFDEMSMSGLCMTYMYIKNKHDHRISVLTTWIVIFTQIDCAIYGASVAVHFSFKKFFSHGAPWKKKKKKRKTESETAKHVFLSVASVSWADLDLLSRCPWAFAKKITVQRMSHGCKLATNYSGKKHALVKWKLRQRYQHALGLDWLFKMFLRFNHVVCFVLQWTYWKSR